MYFIKIKILLFAIFLCILFIGCGTQEQKTEDLGRFNKLSWMENVWRGKQGDASLYESWHKKNFRIMEGITYTTDENGKRVFTQNMRIAQSNNQVYYLIRPDNNPETFKLTSVTDSSAVFENMTKGYPHTITYNQVSDDSMLVSLEGENEGKLMKSILLFEKD